MNILFYCTFPNQKIWIQSIKKKFKREKVYIIKDNIDFQDMDIAIVWNLPNKILSQLTNLQIIFSLGAGVDHILNLPGYKGTPIVRIKDPNMATRMSNHVLSQILYYQLKLTLFQKAQQSKKWLEEKETLLNNEIKVGILGTGFLGTFIGKYLQQLNYKVIGFKNSPGKSKISFPIYAKRKINNFIKECDIIVSVLPSTSKTNNFINQSFLNKMKKNSLLINIGRGTSLNEEHLIKYLKHNKNFYASLDVFKKEPLSKNHKFWKHPNVTVTPHIAALTDIDSSINLMHKRFVSYKKTGKIKSDVDSKKGY